MLTLAAVPMVASFAHAQITIAYGYSTAGIVRFDPYGQAPAEQVTGSIDDGHGLAITPDGAGWVFTHTGRMISVNLTTGVQTDRGLLSLGGPAFYADLAWDPSVDRVIALGHQSPGYRLIAMDPASPVLAATDLGFIAGLPPGAFLSGLAVQPDGTLIAADSIARRLYNLTPSAGVFTATLRAQYASVQIDGIDIDPGTGGIIAVGAGVAMLGDGSHVTPLRTTPGLPGGDIAFVPVPAPGVATLLLAWLPLKTIARRRRPCP